MINKEKIVFRTKTYYTTSYSGAIGVKLLQLLDGDMVLVENKSGKFIRPLMYVYNTQEDARRGGRDWEHYERKRKKKKREERK